MEVPMSNERVSLREIEVRHERDRWRDAVFVVAAVLLTLLSLGALSSKAVGHPGQRHFDDSVTVIESGLEIGQ
jgi:hypothetical protein